MAAAPADRPARIGRYEVIERIGRGGMAEVFLARAVGPGGIAKRLCIKRMLPDLLLTPRALERFSTEARTVLALQHANIVPVFDFGRDGQDLFLAMEWIDGCDLAQLVAATRARGVLLPAEVAAHVTVEVARALAYAHAAVSGRAGLLHSDVTPRNVLLSRQGEVRLTDFGIARALGDAARAGTPAYMAPEAARGEPIDARADLYSLGLVFGEMLLGRRLREQNDLAAACAPVVLPALTGVPGPLAEVARRLLAPAREDRFASANEVVNALAAPLAAALVRGGAAPAQELAALVTLAAPAGVPNEPAEGPVTSAPPTVDLKAPAPSAAPRRGLLVVMTAGLAAALVATGAAIVKRDRPATPLPIAAELAPPPSPRPGVAPADAEAPVTPESGPASTVARAVRHSARAARIKITTPGSWVTVYLDGRALGEGPGVFEVPPGKHQLRVENEPLGFARTESIQAVAGATLELSFQTRR